MSVPDEHVQVRECGIEKGHDRFPRAAGLSPPPIASWRCNLTALSQRHNLYFVASLHKIHVYIPGSGPGAPREGGPRGPRLGGRPQAVLTPTMKNPQASGYISEHMPHSMNNLLVGDLGMDEILLLATDSGNVSAYRTESIYTAIARARREVRLQGRTEHDPVAVGASVPTFFAEWVEMSAWGLAVHKNARMIAVSANTACITVFAFALEAPGEKVGTHAGAATTVVGRTFPDSDWEIIDTPEAFEFLAARPSDALRRARNRRLCFWGHDTNIPSVSFLNSDIDPGGDWMVSTDIDNKLLVWRIWGSSIPVRLFSFRPREHQGIREHLPGTLRKEPVGRGWGVFALDPRVFRSKLSIDAACNGDVRASQGKNNYEVWGKREDIEMDERPEGETEGEIQDGFMGEPSSTTSDRLRQVFEDEDLEDYPVDYYDDDDDDYGYYPGSYPRGFQEYDSDDDNGGWYSLDESIPWDSFPIIHLSESTARVLTGPFAKQPNIAITPLCPPSPYPQPCDASSTNDSPSGPQSRRRHSLGPLHTHHLNRFRSLVYPGFDRFNLAAPIPELGLLIAASQAGRAAVLALTNVNGLGAFARCEDVVPGVPGEMDRGSRDRGRGQQQQGEGEGQNRGQGRQTTTLGQGGRVHVAFGLGTGIGLGGVGILDPGPSLMPLLGIAVGPVPGRMPRPAQGDGVVDGDDGLLDDDEDVFEEDWGDADGMYGGFPERWRAWEYSRRYRLFLTYMDHTVVTYELGYPWPQDVRGENVT